MLKRMLDNYFAEILYSLLGSTVLTLYTWFICLSQISV